MNVAAIVFSMIVVTTSWAPVRAFSSPGMKPQNPPTIAPARIDARIARGAGQVATAAPVPAPATAPIRNWPWAPMLNKPALKPTPTASPPRLSGPAWTSVLTRPLTLPRRPAPSSIAPYALTGRPRSSDFVVTRLDSQIRIDPTAKASTTAPSGTLATEIAPRTRLDHPRRGARGGGVAAVVPVAAGGVAEVGGVALMLRPTWWS